MKPQTVAAIRTRPVSPTTEAKATIADSKGKAISVRIPWGPPVVSASSSVNEIASGPKVKNAYAASQATEAAKD